MTYRIFYTDAPLPAGSHEPDYSKLVPFAEDSEQLAISKALAIIDNRGIVWKIDGPSCHKGKEEINQMYWRVRGRNPASS